MLRGRPGAQSLETSGEVPATWPSSGRVQSGGRASGHQQRRHRIGLTWFVGELPAAVVASPLPSCAGTCRPASSEVSTGPGRVRTASGWRPGPGRALRGALRQVGGGAARRPGARLLVFWCRRCRLCSQCPRCRLCSQCPRCRRCRLCSQCCRCRLCRLCSQCRRCCREGAGTC
jgi:hypothetical protein